MGLKMIHTLPGLAWPKLPPSHHVTEFSLFRIASCILIIIIIIIPVIHMIRTVGMYVF